MPSQILIISIFFINQSIPVIIHFLFHRRFKNAKGEEQAKIIFIALVVQHCKLGVIDIGGAGINSICYFLWYHIPRRKV